MAWARSISSSCCCAGLLCSTAFGLVIGAFVVRYRYIFFGMLNLAFSMVLYSILEKFFYITGGSDGMRLERPSFFGVVMERAEFEVAHVLSGPRARGRDRVAGAPLLSLAARPGAGRDQDPTRPGSNTSAFRRTPCS